MTYRFNQENSEKDFDFHHFINTDHYKMEFHSHNFIEIYLNASGGKNFILKDKIYNINPRDLFVVNSFDVHRVITHEGITYERYVMEFKPSFATPYSSNSTDLLYFINNRSSDFVDKITLSESQFEMALKLIQAYEEINDNVYGADIFRKMKFLEMLTYVAGLFAERDHQARNIAPGTVKDSVTLILEYVNSHFSEPLNLDMIAAETGYSKYHLCKVFKSRTGITINNYITKCRIAYAKQLLIQGCSVTDACYQSGFHDLSHFIRTFKSDIGISPKKYVNDEMSAGDASRYYIGPESQSV